MSVAARLLPPTSSLCSLRALESQSEDQVVSALAYLRSLYCPLPPSSAFTADSKAKLNKVPSVAPTPKLDSGYASGDEDFEDLEEGLGALRADQFERDFALRWLTGFIARSEELMCFTSDNTRQAAVDTASLILSALNSCCAMEEENDDDEGIIRVFETTLVLPSDMTPAEDHDSRVKVSLNDGPLTGSDHTAVGLQSWAAAFLFAELICAEPARFYLTRRSQQFPQGLPKAPKIIELGAGTGLISLVLGKILPPLGTTDSSIVATDFHEVVLANLQHNISLNFDEDPCSIQACSLDWSAPSTEPPFHEPADMLVATDVIYAQEHAVWLRDCAARLLKPDGIFWMLITIRPNGKFEGINKTVEAAFSAAGCPVNEDGKVFKTLNTEKFEKRKGIGRGDESGYQLFKIGWE